jgi:hypothetical protein
MKRNLTDTLEIALEQLRAGEALPDILEQHSAQATELRQLLATAAELEPLRAVEMPTPERQAADRNRFLAEITRARRQTVSAGPLVRVKEWFAPLFTWQATATPIPRREPRRMNVLMLKFVLVVTMLLGSAGGTAVAAANSLPGSPLYPAKLAMEQARLQVATDPSDQAQLHMILAQVRVQEMEQLALAGREPGEAVIHQLQQHLNQALRLAAGMPDQAMQGTLAQWQPKIQLQEQALQQAQVRAAEPAQEPLRLALQLLQQTRQQLQAGLEDGQAFRWQHALGLEPEDVADAAAGECPDCEPVGDPYQHGPEAGQPSPGEPGGSQYRNCTDCEPAGDAHRFGPQPEESGPETPGGPGTGTCDDCEPAGDQHTYGPQPEQPGPGEPGGPAEPPCDGCQPVGDEYQYGPQPDQPGPGEPGGADEPPCDDCEPVGDQHQHGQPPAEPGPADSAGPGSGTCDGCTPEGEQGGQGGSDGGGKSR